MKIIDISRELFSTPVYPGDPVPQRDLIRRMSMGDVCNLTGFYTGCHSATHMDAPRHFIDDGKTIDQMDLSLFVGQCTVIEAEGLITGADIDKIMPECEKDFAKGRRSGVPVCQCCFCADGCRSDIGRHGCTDHRNGR